MHNNWILSKTSCAISQNFLTVGESKSARCDDLESLKKRNCAVTKIENPRGSITIDKNKPVTNRKKDSADKPDPGQITQIQPQKLTLTIRTGKYSFILIESIPAKRLCE